jgi:xylulokinase
LSSKSDHMFLGLDLGTSELKGLLLNDQHQVLATAGAALDIQRPKSLWSEQSPLAWWQALDRVMQQLQGAHPQALAQLQGIGLSGQMHGAVLLDETETVLRPAILWNDGRSAAQCTLLSALVPELSSITGNLAMPGFTAPKLLWVREHEPQVFAATRRVLLPKDWLRLQLTGEAVSEMSDAAGTLWLNTALRDWSDTVLAACGLNRSHMPRLVEGSEVSAHLKPEWCRRWGLPAHVPVAGGAGDNAASAVGMGLVRPGEGFVSLGTSGVVFVSGARFAPNPSRGLHAFCHALPGRWHQMSVMLSAASAVSWAVKSLGFDNETCLLAAAERLTLVQRHRAPVFLPYLSGERTPHNHPLATAAWFGMTTSHGRDELAYAVAEGVAFGLRDGLLTLGVQEPVLTSLSLVGGGARNVWWAQLLADVLGLPLTLHHGAESGAALGAARLAWLACGGGVEDVCTVPTVSRRFTPQPSLEAGLMQRHQRFQALYRALLPLMV